MAPLLSDTKLPLTLSEQLDAMLCGWLDRHAPDGDLGDPGQPAAGVVTVASDHVPEVEAFCDEWDMTVTAAREPRRRVTPCSSSEGARCPCAASSRSPRCTGAERGGGGRRALGPPAAGRAAQKTRTATSAGASKRLLSSSSSLTNVIEAPAMSSEVQYSPT